MKHPDFEKRKGNILIFKSGSQLSRDDSIEIGMKVMVCYHTNYIILKVIDKVSDQSFIGLILKFSIYTGPKNYEDLCINDKVEFYKDSIILLFRGIE